MKITKSSRHAKIAGDFGEHLVLYWLSKYGYECARIDHTGIDIIARSPTSNQVIGISVKSRTRSEGTESDHVNIGAGAIAKARAACLAFNCVPYFAIVVDAGATINGFIVSVEHLSELGMQATWSMKNKALQQYATDRQILSFILKTETQNWWK